VADPGDDLLAIATSIVDRAQPGEQVDVMVSRGSSTSIRVFEGEVEAFTSARTAGVGVRVIVDGRVGFAHAGSLAPDVVADLLAEARDNVPFSEPDDAAGLAEPDGVEPVAHDQWNPAVLALSAEERIARAVELERRVRGLDPRISGVRSAAWGDGSGEVAYAGTNGIARVDRGTSCSIGVQPLATDGAETQIGYAGDASRDPDELDDERVARDAVDRATRLLGATQPASARLTILLEPRLVGSLLGIVSGMLDGESVLKGRSPFAHRVGEQIASPLLSLVDDPTRAESISADSWDGEGLACRANPLVEGGVLAGFLHNSHTGRRMGVPSTGSAVRGARSTPGVGARVLVLEPGRRSFDELVASIELGLFVGSLAGLHSGVNPVSGDFSVGADGLMIRDGALAEPVREITIASTLQRLLLDVVEVGGDAEWLPSGDHLASLVIGDVAMSGA
jgi:PmbA protein